MEMSDTVIAIFMGIIAKELQFSDIEEIFVFFSNIFERLSRIYDKQV